MVNRLIVATCAAAAGCGSFEDPDVVVDLRVIAMTSSPPTQMVDIDLAQPMNPAALLAQLAPTEVCALVADPTNQRRLTWSLVMCPPTSNDRCDVDTRRPLASGILDDPDTTRPEPALCATIEPDATLLGLLLDVLQDDDLHGLGGIDYRVELRVGGESADRELDQYAAKTVQVAPHIPAAATANTNPRLNQIDTAVGDVAAIPMPLGRCVDNPRPLVVTAGSRLRMSPIEPDGVREAYVVPTLDGKSQMFTESLTYQWIASAGGFSSGSTGGPHDLSGNPAPLLTEFRAPAAHDVTGPTPIAVWVVQRDERFGAHWYEACVLVVP